MPEAPERLAREVVGFVHRLREADLTKVPGIAETLDWAAALLSLGARELAPELVDETLGVVLKYEEDIRQVRGDGDAPIPGRGRRPAADRHEDTHVTDPAIVRAPFGPEVDGRRLLQEAVGFGRSLRAARLSIDLGAAVDFARALTLVDIADREQVRAAGAAVFVRRRDDRAVYDAAFDRWWRQRGSRFSDEFQPSTLRSPDDAMVEEEAPGTTPPEPGADRGEMGPDERGTPIPSEGDADGDDEAPDRGRRSSRRTRTRRARCSATASSTG